MVNRAKWKAEDWCRARFVCVCVCRAVDSGLSLLVCFGKHVSQSSTRHEE